jgi:hypothetical protein
MTHSCSGRAVVNRQRRRATRRFDQDAGVAVGGVGGRPVRPRRAAGIVASTALPAAMCRTYSGEPARSARNMARRIAALLGDRAAGLADVGALDLASRMYCAVCHGRDRRERREDRDRGLREVRAGWPGPLDHGLAGVLHQELCGDLSSAVPVRRDCSGRELQLKAWQWAQASRAADGALPSGRDTGRRYGRHERWGRLVKRSGLAGELDTYSQYRISPNSYAGTDRLRSGAARA